jgi:hypothetical protein
LLTLRCGIHASLGRQPPGRLRYLLLKAKRMAVTNVEFLAVQRVKKAA